MTQAEEVRRGYEQFVPPPAPLGMYSTLRRGFSCRRAYSLRAAAGWPPPGSSGSCCSASPSGSAISPGACSRGDKDDRQRSGYSPAVLAAGTSPDGRAETDGAAPGHRVLPERPAAIWILYLAERPVPAVSRRLLRRHGDPSRPGRSSAVILRRPLGPASGTPDPDARSSGVATRSATWRPLRRNWPAKGHPCHVTVVTRQQAGSESVP